MFVLGNFIQALAYVLNTLITLYYYILIIRVLLSWVNPDPYNPIVQMLYKAADPYLNLFRRFIPPLGRVDISAIIGILALVFVQQFLIQSLYQIAAMFQ